MTDHRYIRAIGLTLLAALLVVEPVQTESQEISPDDRAAIEAGPVFTPMTVRPEIRNRADVVWAVYNEYPEALRDAGIGGSVVVWVYISETGQNLHNRISRSSGQEQFDQAALRVAHVIRFTPAMNPPPRTPGAMPNAVTIGEAPVAVWIEVPITFVVPEA